MNELTRICKGLSATRPTLNLEQLVALEEPFATFETHIPAEQGRDFWIYTVDGKTLEGEVIVVRASLPNQAEAMAQEGLRDTIAAYKKFDMSTGLEATVEVRGVQ
jgi:hypothetical protein